MKVLVTGGKGFLGKALARVLVSADLDVVVAGRSDGDLTMAGRALSLFQSVKPDAVIHLAAVVGGIGANQMNPAVFWQQNLLMGMNVLDACLSVNAAKLVMVGTTCSYPKTPKTIPFVEEELFDGYPEETNAPYGIAKRSLIVGALAYHRQFGLDVSVAVPTNLYGPEDNFDLKTSHVIPALIRKMHEARVRGEKFVEIWGSGKATRDFLYVEDAAKGLATILLKGKPGSITNLGSGSEVSVASVAESVSRVTGFGGRATYDKSKPDGQPRRCLDIGRAKALGWKPETSLLGGLEMTYHWWKASKPK